MRVVPVQTKILVDVAKTGRVSRETLDTHGNLRGHINWLAKEGLIRKGSAHGPGCLYSITELGKEHLPRY